MIDNKFRLERTKSVQHREVDGQIFLIDDELDEIRLLDPIGSAVWRVLDEPMVLKEIVTLFQTAFPDRPKSAVRKEISKFAENLLNLGFLQKA